MPAQQSLNMGAAIFLDLGQTLIQPTQAVGHVYHRVALGHGVASPGDPQQVQQRFTQAFHRLRQRARAAQVLAYGQTEEASCAFWRELVGQVLELEEDSPTREAIFQDLYGHFATAAAWTVFPDAFPLIRKTRQLGWHLGLVSNWDARISRVLEVTGLALSFDVVISSHAVGFEKPDERIFREACRCLEVVPGRDIVLHVGDTLEEDVEGARRAGLVAFHLDREHRYADAPFRIRSLKELHPVLENPHHLQG